MALTPAMYAVLTMRAGKLRLPSPIYLREQPHFRVCLLGYEPLSILSQFSSQSIPTIH
jgi:hypothetical protein